MRTLIYTGGRSWCWQRYWWWLLRLLFHRESWILLPILPLRLFVPCRWRAFRKVNGNAYATTMCTGNLRSGMEHIHKMLFQNNRRIQKSSTGIFWHHRVLYFWRYDRGVGGRPVAGPGGACLLWFFGGCICYYVCQRRRNRGGREKISIEQKFLKRKICNADLAFFNVHFY